MADMLTAPAVKPANPNFSSGPCAKRPGWTTDALKSALVGRSHRAKPAKARIEKVIAYLQTFSAKDFAGAAERHVSQPRWAGKYLTGHEFAVQHMIPNFYFHVTTAYAILRANGVDLGKKDYLGAMPFKE